MKDTNAKEILLKKSLAKMEGLPLRDLEKVDRFLNLLSSPGYRKHDLRELALFQELTAYRFAEMVAAEIPVRTQWAESGDEIELPPPRTHAEEAFSEVLIRRRSRREYLARPLKLQAFADLLYFTYGRTASYPSARGYEVALRTAPSAGALYPIDVFVVVHRVEDLTPGLYLYRTKDHFLQGIYRGDCRDDLVRGALDQDFLGDAAAVLLLVAFPERMFFKYGIRGYRYLYLDAGHIAQNAYLAAELLHLGACEVGAFYDDYLNRLFGFDGKTAFIATMVSIGIPVE